MPRAGALNLVVDCKFQVASIYREIFGISDNTSTPLPMVLAWRAWIAYIRISISGTAFSRRYPASGMVAEGYTREDSGRLEAGG
jgi:hypothetical protein